MPRASLIQPLQNQELFVAEPYRSCLKMSGRTEVYYLRADGSVIKPVYEEYSRSGAHGTWYYPRNVIEEEAVVRFEIEVSNSGRHYCDIKLLKKIDPEDALRIAVKIYNLHGEWLCNSLYNALARMLAEAGFDTNEIQVLLSE